ncbi:hypothetical protein ACRAWG_21575 [Methylobacterium sp. P31]
MTSQRDQFGRQLGSTTPTRGSNLGETAPIRQGGGRNNDAGGGNVHVGAVHISVPGAGDPKAVAAEVNNQFRSRMMARLHDVDPTAV